MSPRRAHLVTAVALAGALVMPGAVLAAKPDADAPPAPVVIWQKHLGHMRDMGPNLGSHVRDCVAMHGSMAGMMGPNGMMVEGLAGMMGGEAQP